MGDSCHKAYLSISVQAKLFYKEQEGKQNKEMKGKGMTSTVHPDKELKAGQVMVWYISSWVYG